jgi:hypothetical protein
LLSQYAEYTALSTGFQNRLQTLDGNSLWRRPYLGEVAGFGGNVCGLPDPLALQIGQTNTPPYCFTTSIVPRTTVTPADLDQLTVGKPAVGSLAAAAAGTQTPAAASAPQTYNGVDQRALAACLAADPSSCLTTVPGLAQCLAAHQSCNAVTRQSVSPSGRRHPTTAAQAQALARSDLHDAKARKVTTLTSAELRSRSGLTLDGIGNAEALHVVTGDEQVHGLITMP